MQRVRALRWRIQLHAAERRSHTPAPAGRDNTPTIATVDGFELHLPAHFRYHYVDHAYEPLSLNFVRANVREGHIAVDAGAHIGFVTLHLARAVGPSGRVLAIEPAKENADYVRRNAESNGFAQVKVIEAAASDRSGTARFRLTQSSDSDGFYRHPNIATHRVIEVPTIRVDSLATSVDFFKVDTEGAEIETLEGMREMLRNSPGATGLVEWTPACQRLAGRRRTELLTWLRDQGFELKVLDDAAHVEREPADVLALLDSRSLPDSWYANLACLPRRTS
jgi:FkbM family methyltransferase